MLPFMWIPVLLIGLSAPVEPEAALDPGEPRSEEHLAVSSPGGPVRAGLWAFVDPLTGELLEPSEEALRSLVAEHFSPEVQEALSTSHEGLYSVETDDGVMLDLQGRFQSVVFAIVGVDGEPATTHDPAVLLNAMIAAGKSEAVP